MANGLTSNYQTTFRCWGGVSTILGGVPKELIFDQDKLMTVSENYGDIIYTYEFEKFKQAMGFTVSSAAKMIQKARVSLKRSSSI